VTGDQECLSFVVLQVESVRRISGVLAVVSAGVHEEGPPLLLVHFRELEKALLHRVLALSALIEGPLQP
jgi:hypothetical protein